MLYGRPCRPGISGGNQEPYTESAGGGSDYEPGKSGRVPLSKEMV